MKRRASGFRPLSSVLIGLGLVLGVASNPGHAQDPGGRKTPARVPERATSLSGWFTIVWGDSRDGRTAMVYTLTGVSGRRTVLRLDEAVARRLGGVLRFNGKYVRVQGGPATSRPAAVADSAQGLPAVLDVLWISLLPEPLAPTVGGTPESASLAVVSGSRPWVTIMCKFSDIAAEPNDLAYFQGMYGDTRPGLNHYWKEVSFDTANVAGSTTGAGWYTLPHTEGYYNPTDTEKGTDLSSLAGDCIAAADTNVDYSLYSGINMMFNSDFDNGWAWGGGTGTITLDGVTKSWSITWEPPWAYHDVSVIAHEMGHGFGLPHSSYDRTDVYDNAWDVMSWDRYNCGAGAAARDATYGCMAQHTISYHKDLMGWIPGAQRTTVASGTWATVTLEDLAAPTSTNYQIAIVPIGGSVTNFYTVEARRHTGYDAKLPGEAVIVHDVDTTNDIPAVQVPGGKSSTHPDVRFTAGESFRDAANKITITVDSDNTAESVVTILNGIERPTGDAGGPYTQECAGPSTTVLLDGSASSDPEGSILKYSWSTTCDGTFDDPTSPKPILTVSGATGCAVSCTASLTVTDDQNLSDEDSANVTITDTTPPALSGVPASQTVQCDAVPPRAPVAAADICDGSVAPAFSETRVDGTCAAGYTLTRKWTAADECGNSSSGSQTITVEDTVAPAIACNNPPTMRPPDAPMTFTATGTDNCSTPSVRITGYDCMGKKRSRLSSCVVAIAGSTITILDSGGVSDTISWTVESVDGCGNTATKTCSIQVVNPGRNK